MDITTLILDDHHEQRRLFSILQEIGTSDTDALQAVWGRLRDLLDAHAEAEERHFYPKLLQVGTGAADADSAAEETEELGSSAWFDALAKADQVNGDHMAEEERQGLPDMRRNVSLEERHALAVKFTSFMHHHRDGVAPVDKDPETYINEGGDVDASAEA